MPKPTRTWSYERTAHLGSGDAHWNYVSSELLHWGIKTRSGFTIKGNPRAEPDHRYWLLAHIGPFTIHEPVEVTAVIDEPNRAAFTYTTLPGHPIRGTEVFEAERHADDSITLTIRSRTRAAPGLRRLIYPAALVAQRFYRRRYFAALLAT
ncbi:hypothetical protein GCM10009630_70010 [Kribbella jejuensis]|uniref:Uncharacterized protein (UPF0548 family) n=1 Tax=Kribbella jejuensis TaxID=236068 RepID=A0A542DU95_9ACTN|nr:DUF1990 domain-containing protein [Kribbella jejuensis]TQJ06681.1 uncharacterized protein (UPF0548 family) [Kribbella jejuensis]